MQTRAPDAAFPFASSASTLRSPSRPAIDGTTCAAPNEISLQAMELPRMPGRAIPSRDPDVAGRTLVMPRA